ncbi:Protein of unknown function [Bacillus toyonensis]|nr:Protein of unknown function [Bacillus toyonensis]
MNIIVENEAVIALLVFGMFVRQKLSEKELSREG